MNPYISRLQLYPFEKLAKLTHGISPPQDKSPIVLSIGEPKHPTPDFIRETLIQHLSGLSNYPTTKGLPELRNAISQWIARRFAIPETAIHPETQVLPVNGTREALFSFVQTVLDPAKKPRVLMPNPFYQIYEGAALLAGATPYFLNTTAKTDYLPDFDSVPDEVWKRCGLVFICSPGNPTGALLSLAQLEKLLLLAEKFDFLIASDECYSELYVSEQYPPPGLLQAAYQMGNTTFKRCVMFQSLSKRSNVPGLRSGFVAGDAAVLADFFKYRTYHGCPMPLPTQYASIAAWQDENHVIENRQLYRDKFKAFIEILSPICQITQPPAGFYVWLKTPISDIEFTQQLFAQQNVTVLPGSYLSRTAFGINPGDNYVRIALVAPLAECIDAANRIKTFMLNLTHV